MPGADDLNAHLARLRSLTPETARGVILRHRIRPGRFEVVRDASGQIRFQEFGRKDPARHALLDFHASNWYFDGEPPVEGYRGIELPLASLYESLLPSDHHVCNDNLRRTDSHVVLAGRSGGRTATKEILSAIRLRGGGQEANLSALLAIHGWQPQNVSRIRYFNPRMGMDDPFDRPAPEPALVIADGPGAFEAVLDCGELANSNVLAVIPRTADPDQLEHLAVRVETLTQWYEGDLEIGVGTPPLPAGVEMATLRRGS